MIKPSKVAEQIYRNEEKNYLWTTRYFPKEKKEIPLYKMAQVEKFENLLNNTLRRIPSFPKVIVVTGPVGCGKTTLVTVICREKRIQIIKFTPDEEYFDKRDYENSQESPFIIMLNQFLEKCQTVIDPDIMQVLLIDDITLDPKDRNDFFRSINEYNSSPRPLFPLIWIADQNDTQQKIPNCYYFPFPAASRSVLKRVLKNVSQKQHLNLKDAQINSIIDENPGDVRLAVNMLQFAENFSTGKYDYLSYFQAIGEILYQKNRLSSEDILRISHCSPKMMIKGLYENSLDFFSDVTEYADCADEFSAADEFMGMSFVNPELAELAATTSMRGVLTTLCSRQENRFFGMRQGSKSHLRNNDFRSDLFHQELVIEDLISPNDHFQCWPKECKSLNSGQTDSMIFDEMPITVAKSSFQQEMDKKIKERLREEEVSKEMELLADDPIEQFQDLDSWFDE